MTRAALAGIAAFSVGYLLPGTLQLPVPLYDPVRHAWTIARAASGMTMRYYGDLLVACASGIVATLVTSRLRPRTPLPIAAGTALSLVALDVLYYLSRLLAAR
ncbi:MAG TPA: hypothetical protein VLW85_04160 [Myxococcales bacterium]|nr:hypothetical protein [Myxococcales bacterium]